MRLDYYALAESVHAAEASAHSLLARIVEIRRGLELFPGQGAHPMDLERVTSAAVHISKATTLLRQYHLPRP
jgi:hypothetical protein